MNTQNLRNLAQLAEQLYREIENRSFNGERYDHDYTDEQMKKNQQDTLNQIKQLVEHL